MRFGSAKDLITPPFRMKLACSGDFDSDFSYIHDDIFVRCLVMDDGKSKCALFSFDILFHDRSLNKALEEYAEETYGITSSAVIIGSTHSHMAPATSGYNRNYDSPEYEAFMLERAKTCLDRAICTMYEGTIEYTSFRAEFNISRRGIVDGKFRISPAPDRYRDTEFALLVIRDLRQDVRSIVMNYGCHPVFYPATDSVSGEFPARVCQLLEAKYYGCLPMYFQSAGADVRPTATVFDGKFKSPLPFSAVDAFAHSICNAVCDEVDRKYEPIKLNFASDAFKIRLPINTRSLDFFKGKWEILAKGTPNPDYINARYIVEEGGYDKLNEHLDLHCQTVQLTDSLVIAAVGGEPTSGVKKCIKDGLSSKKVFFIGYTDACAYIVDDVELEEGGYEPECHLEYCLKGPFMPGLDEKFRLAFRASLERIERK